MTTLAELTLLAGQINEKNGYNGYAQAVADGYGVEYLAKKDLLEVGELAEALEELRHGNPADLIYTSGSDEKPEGYLIEKFDAVIRSLGTIYEVIQVHGMDLNDTVGYLEEKIAYNARRADTKASGIKAF